MQRKWQIHLGGYLISVIDFKFKKGRDDVVSMMMEEDEDENGDKVTNISKGHMRVQDGVCSANIASCSLVVSD